MFSVVPGSQCQDLTQVGDNRAAEADTAAKKDL